MSMAGMTKTRRSVLIIRIVALIMGALNNPANV